MRFRTLAGLLAVTGVVILGCAYALLRERPGEDRLPGSFSAGSTSGSRTESPPSPAPLSTNPRSPASPPAPAAPEEKKPPTPSRPEEYLLRVFDNNTKRAVVGATVVATPIGNNLDPDSPPVPISGFTDSDGYVRLALDPLAGGYTLRVSGEGRATAEQEIHPGTGGQFLEAEVGMSPAGSIVGRVLDAEGKPMASAMVYVDGSTGIFHLDRARIEGRMGEFPDVPTLSARVRSTTTGKDGSFRMDGVPVGQVLVVFSVTGSGSPSIPDPAFKVPAEDAVAHPDLRLLPDSSLSVRFLDKEGNGTGEAIQAWVETRLGYVPLASTSLGVFEASHLDPGVHDLLFVPEVSAFGIRPVAIQEGRRVDLDVKLDAGIRVSGTVERVAGIPVPGIAVEARGNTPGVVASVPLRAQVSDNEGNFSFPGLPRRETVFAVRGPATGFLYEQGSFPLSGEVRLLVPAAVRAVLKPDGDLPFRPKTILRAWAGPTEGDVHLVPLDQPGNVSFDPRTGEFGVKELPAGACTLRIAVSGMAVMSRDLRLPSGETTDLGTIPLAAGYPLEGTVSAPDGRGQPGIRVRAWYANGESLSTYTGPDGRFQFRSLRPGPATIEFHDAVSRETRFALETRAVTVEAGTPPVRVELQEGGLVEVFVKRRDGGTAMCTLVGCDPRGVPYRPVPEPFVPVRSSMYGGRRLLGPATITLYDERGVLVASAPVTIRQGRPVPVTLYER